ncbi:MAG: hypothetical protein GTN83_00600, partial [Acidobacteria bacterium]|nr:hypothetical protein [Acidobacteriota bacterium]
MAGTQCTDLDHIIDCQSGPVASCDTAALAAACTGGGGTCVPDLDLDPEDCEGDLNGNTCDLVTCVDGPTNC